MGCLLVNSYLALRRTLHRTNRVSRTAKNKSCYDWVKLIVLLFKVAIESSNGPFKFCADVKSIKMRFSRNIDCEDYVEMRNMNDFYDKWERSMAINGGDFSLMALTLIVLVLITVLLTTRKIFLITSSQLTGRIQIKVLLTLPLLLSLIPTNISRSKIINFL